MDMLNAVKSVLPDVSRVISPSSEQRDISLNKNQLQRGHLGGGGFYVALLVSFVLATEKQGPYYIMTVIESKMVPLLII